MVLEEFCEIFRRNVGGRFNSWSDFRKFAENFDLCFSHGATRAVFYAKDWDFVVKMCLKNQHNYNDDEVEHYKSGVKYGIEKILLETSFIAEINGFALYKQPRYDFSFYEMPKNFRRALKRKGVEDLAEKPIVEKIQYGSYTSIQTLWLAYALLLYGKKFMLSFEKWQKENRVNDLHNGNIGFYKGRPIILDYAGY